MKLHHPLQSHTSSVVPEFIIGFAQTHHLFLPHPDTPHFSTGTGALLRSSALPDRYTLVYLFFINCVVSTGWPSYWL